MKNRTGKHSLVTIKGAREEKSIRLLGLMGICVINAVMSLTAFYSQSSFAEDVNKDISPCLEIFKGEYSHGNALTLERTILGLNSTEKKMLNLETPNWGNVPKTLRERFIDLKEVAFKANGKRDASTVLEYLLDKFALKCAVETFYKNDENQNINSQRLMFWLNSSDKSSQEVAFLVVDALTEGRAKKILNDLGLENVRMFVNKTHKENSEGSGARDVNKRSLLTLVLRGHPDDVKVAKAVLEGANKTLKQEWDPSGIQTHVFRLRYASVVATSQKMGGQTVQVPGVEDALKKMLGADMAGPRPGEQPMGWQIIIPAASTGKTANADTHGRVDESSQDKNLPSGGQDVSILDRVFVSSDVRSNSIIARGSQSSLAQICVLLKGIDVQQAMVELDVMIVNAHLGVSNELGFLWGASGSTGRRGFAVNSGLPNDAFNVTPSTVNDMLKTRVGGPLPGAGFILPLGSVSTLRATMQALEKQDLVRTIAAPKVITLDNVPARVGSGESVSIPVSVGTDRAPGLKELEAGIKLEIVPSVYDYKNPDTANVSNLDKCREKVQKSTESYISEEDPTKVYTPSANAKVRLKINAENGIITGETPNFKIAKSEVSTEVLLPNQRTFLFGGLFNENVTNSTSKVPKLGDVPLLGNLFKEDLGADGRTELIFFVTPRIVDEGSVKHLSGENTRGYVEHQKEGLRQEVATRSPKGWFHGRSSMIEEEE